MHGTSPLELGTDLPATLPAIPQDNLQLRYLETH